MYYGSCRPHGLMSMVSTLLSAWLLLTAGLVEAVSVTGSRVLAVVDAAGDEAQYGQFFADLRDRGLSIDVETPTSASLSLTELGERKYDHLLLLTPKSKVLGNKLSAQSLVEFVGLQGNVLMGLSSEAPVPMSIVNFLEEVDIHIPSSRSGVVVDHFHYDQLSAPALHDVLVVDVPRQPPRPDLKSYFTADEASQPVLAFPRGVAQVLGPSPLVAPLVRAPATAYSFHPRDETEAELVHGDELFGTGQQLALVSAAQARNSARVSVFGSAAMLTDTWFDGRVRSRSAETSATWNRELAKRVSAWTFQELGVIRVDNVVHHLNDHADDPAALAVNPSLYRIKTDVAYAIALSEYVWDQWVPFHVPEGDALQLEFSMLSPYFRLTLAPLSSPPALLSSSSSSSSPSPSPSSQWYGVSFTLPDQHGIFNFFVNYKRPYLTNLEDKQTVTVRHFAHDEWARSWTISGAWPWISGVGVTITGFLAFSIVWMYSREVPSRLQEK